jgi:hypothetical protein
VPVLQALNPKFKCQSHQKKKRERERESGRVYVVNDGESVNLKEIEVSRGRKIAKFR